MKQLIQTMPSIIVYWQCKILVRSVQRKHSEAPGVTWGNRGTCNIGGQAIVSSGIL